MNHDLILAKIQELLEAVRDAYQGKPSYVPAVRAVEVFRVRIVSRIRRKNKVRTPVES
jgi:hypothetical protein